MSDQFSSLTFTPFIAILLRLTCLIYQEGINNSLEEFEEFNLEENDWTPCQERFSNTVLGSEKFIERITLEHINPSVDTNIKDSYQINKAYRNKVQEIKDYASKLKVDFHHL